MALRISLEGPHKRKRLKLAYDALIVSAANRPVDIIIDIIVDRPSCAVSHQRMDGASMSATRPNHTKGVRVTSGATVRSAVGDGRIGHQNRVKQGHTMQASVPPTTAVGRPRKCSQRSGAGCVPSVDNSLGRKRILASRRRKTRLSNSRQIYCS